MKVFAVAPEVHYGEDSLKTLKQLKCKRVLLVTDPGMVQFGIAEKVTAILDESHIEWEIFKNVEPNPSIETVTAILKHFMAYAPDGVIGLGGGSPIDAAKGALYFANRLQKNFTAIAAPKKPYFVAIPTTSGTGSEVTSYAVLTDMAQHTKIALSDSCMLPDLAVLDPIFTKTLPKGVIADTGMDVLTHATEAFVSKARNPYTNALAIEAIKDVFSHLLPNYHTPSEESHRTAMQNASCMAGIAFNNSSLGINHSLAHALGGRFQIPHGKINAILLPYVVRFNGCEVRAAKTGNRLAIESYAQISKQLGLPCETESQGVTSYVVALEVLKEQLSIHKTLKDYGIDETIYLSAIDTLAEQALNDICTAENPISVRLEDLKAVLKTVYYGM
jgi:alcohol dehydrogenase class IV